MSANLASNYERRFTVVLGLDLADQESSGYAFDQAMRIASRIDHSEVQVLYVMPESASAEAAAEALGLLRLYVTEKSSALGSRGPRRAAIHVRRGDTAHELARLASDLQADVIIVGTRRAAAHLNPWAGSTAERVMAATALPVLVAGPRPRPHPSHIISIDPPCPDCLAARSESAGRVWWCARHSENHHLRHHHVYSYQPDFPFSTHDSEVVPTGID
jgi:nucleotide-binding universal stress UspA family protein